MGALLVPSDYARPAPPAAIADAVELWARKSGRHARLEWNRVTSWWEIHLSLKPDDPQMRAYREGKVGEEPTETVPLIEWDGEKGAYAPIPIEQYGAAGVVFLLEKGDSWSGRGEFSSLQEAVTVAASRAREGRQRVKDQQRQWARDLGGDVRRSVLKIPYLPVGIDLKNPTR